MRIGSRYHRKQLRALLGTVYSLRPYKLSIFRIRTVRLALGLLALLVNLDLAPLGVNQ